MRELQLILQQCNPVTSSRPVREPHIPTLKRPSTEANPVVFEEPIAKKPDSGVQTHLCRSCSSKYDFVEVFFVHRLSVFLLLLSSK